MRKIDVLQYWITLRRQLCKLRFLMQVKNCSFTNHSKRIPLTFFTVFSLCLHVFIWVYMHADTGTHVCRYML